MHHRCANGTTTSASHLFIYRGGALFDYQDALLGNFAAANALNITVSHGLSGTSNTRPLNEVHFSKVSGDLTRVQDLIPLGAVRTALTVEMWDAINGGWLELKRFATAQAMREELPRFLRLVQECSLRFDGSAYRTMLRNDAYWFSRLGLFIERADNTARILDVKYHLLLPPKEHVGGPLDYFQWAAILRSVSALTSYHWVYRESLKPWLVADLLILNDQMPRSLASCYENLVRYLDQIARFYGRQGPSQRLARAVRTRLENSRMEELFQRGLHDVVGEFVADNNRLGSAITQQYLM